MAVFKSDLSEVQLERHHVGKTPFMHTRTIPTTALDSGDEQVLLYFFGEEEAFLDTLLLSVDDLDSGTPALVFDVGIGDVDGVVDTVLESASTAGQAGGDVDASPTFPVEVTNKFLILDVTTAAGTAAAGDVQFYGEFSAGLRQTTETVA